jgi:DNA-directed RNA polymerase I, II, and III subunit RPABC2
MSDNESVASGGDMADDNDNESVSETYEDIMQEHESDAESELGESDVTSDDDDEDDDGEVDDNDDTKSVRSGIGHRISGITTYESADKQKLDTKSPLFGVKYFNTEGSKYVVAPQHSVTDTIVPNELRRMRNIMSAYMYTQIISARVEILQQDPKVYCNIDGITDPIEIAKKEIRERKCPLMFVCYVAPKVVEMWSPNEMTLPGNVDIES